MGLLGNGGGEKIPLPNICYIYPTMTNIGTVIPYLRKIQKLYKSREAPHKKLVIFVTLGNKINIAI